jgi:hypothetical protein
MILQLVRWCMRGHDMNDHLAMTADANDGEIDVVINALDHDDAHLNYLSLIGTAILPDGKTQNFPLDQAAPGRYTAKLPATEPGNYFLAVSGGERTAPLRAAINVPATEELDDLFSYDGFLAELAESTPRGGQPGRLITAARGIGDTAGLLVTDVFRPGLAPAKSRDAVWPLMLVLASGLFLGDIMCRRLKISFDWLPRITRLLPGQHAPERSGVSPPMERLKQSKATATARFNQTAGTSPDAMRMYVNEAAPDSGSQVTPVELTDTSAAPSLVSDNKPEHADFTARLLQAKQRLHERDRRSK